VLDGAPTVLPGGAAALSSDSRAFVLIDDGDPRRFGPALAWAVRTGSSSLDVVVDGSPTAPGVVSRRAGGFGMPIGVWAVSDRTLSAAAPSPAVVDGGDPPADLVSVLSAAGLEVVWEHGVLRGEVLGLEVVRTVGDTLEVGVGRFDRTARLEMRPSESLSRALAEAAAAVSARRRPGAPSHPANTLARSRWLRSVVMASPSSVGCSLLEPVAPPLPSFDLTELGAAPAVGRRLDGRSVVVVCSVGVDLDLVPTAVDVRSQGPGAELMLVLPAGDDVAVTRQLAGLVREPSAQVVTVAREWAAGL
jgi:hypothetical protein